MGKVGMAVASCRPGEVWKTWKSDFRAAKATPLWKAYNSRDDIFVI